MPLHHAGYVVSDLARSKEFYLAALAPLGYKVIKEFEGLAVGLGRSAYEADLWLSAGKSRDGGADKPPSTGLHVALKADSRAVVDQFHAAALCVHLLRAFKCLHY
jgi:catechol 2,3-dioxygenase-like lactoylglutathione lyase family enzyme